MTSRNTPPGGDSTPGAGDAAPAATTTSLADLEQRVRRLESSLSAFFGALATTAQPPAAGATGEAGSGPAEAGTPSTERVEERLRWLERAVLRVQLEVGALGAPGEPWDPDATLETLLERRAGANAPTETPPVAERHWIVSTLERLRGQELPQMRDDDDAWLEPDALRERAERLARRLLLERDGDALRQRGVKAGCWDAEGVLIGVGATADEAKLDAARRFGAAGVVTRLVADVPPVDAEAAELDDYAWLDAVRGARGWPERVAEFERLARWLADTIEALPADEAAAASRRLDAALLAAGTPAARAEALARKLLLRRDGESLRWHGVAAACWDFNGRLIGTGETRGDALRDAVAHEGPEPEGVAWLTAEVSSEDEVPSWLDPALRRLADMADAAGDAFDRRLEALEHLARRLLIERDAETLRQRGATTGCWDEAGRLIGTGATAEDARRDAVAKEGSEPDGEAWLTAELRDAGGDE